MRETFRALYAETTEGKGYRVGLRELNRSELPSYPDEVLVDVAYSSLNYKDGLAITAKGKIIRRFPMVLGIDVAGTVVESKHPAFRPGDGVLAVGQGLGETIWGGYAELQRVPGNVLVRLPEGLSLQQAMSVGTAGFTSMLAVLALEQMGLTPGEREVVVSGAAGGVGSLAVHLLARLGYKPVASTGRVAESEWLTALGATRVIDRSELAQPSPPLASEKWAAAIDTVGGQTLATLLAQTASFGSVAACGMASSAELHTTVFPFILRNVNLLGVNSTQTPPALREAAWKRLAATLDLAKLDALTTVEPMSKLESLAATILEGRVRGRVVIDVRR
ncbi:MAG: MDR family oxidoreductase [Myxococcales bacterium]